MKSARHLTGKQLELVENRVQESSCVFQYRGYLCALLSMKVRPVSAVIGLLSAFTLAATFYAWRFSYFWLDDFNVFFWVQRLDYSLGRMVWDCINPFANAFRPFGILFYWIFWHIFGLSPLPYHLFAWAIHTANVILLFVLLSRIVGSRYGAAVGALLFGFRANFTDIYWSFGTIFELLALFLMLLAMLAYSSEMKFRWKLVTAVLLYLLAVKSKEMAITLPALLLLFDISFSRERWTRKLTSLYAVLVLFGLALGYSKLTTIESASRTAPYYMDISALTLGRGYGWYFDHLYGMKIRWGAWGIVSVLLIAFFIYRRERRGLFFLGYVYITLLPVIFLVNHRYEFFWYIPFFGISGLAAVLADSIEKLLRVRISENALAFAAAVVFACLSAGHWLRESSASAEVIRVEASAAVEFEALVTAVRHLPSPETGAVIYFTAFPKYFDAESLNFVTQVTLRRTDVSPALVDAFPDPCRSCVQFMR